MTNFMHAYGIKLLIGLSIFILMSLSIFLWMQTPELFCYNKKTRKRSYGFLIVLSLNLEQTVHTI